MFKVTGYLTRISVMAASTVLVAMVLFVIYEITLRAVFDASTYVLDEFIGYGVAIVTFLALSATLRDGAFIRVNLLTANVSGPVRRFLEIIFCLLGAGIFGFIAFYIGKLVVRNYTRGVVSNSIAEVPLWIPQSVLLFGLILLVLQFAVLAARYLLGQPVVDHHEEL